MEHHPRPAETRVSPALALAFLGTVAALVAGYQLAYGGGAQWGHAAAQLTAAAAAVVLALAFRRRGTERRAEAQRASVERDALARHYDLLLRHASDVVLLVGPGGRVLDVNDRAVETYGRSRNELLAMQLRDLVATDDTAELTRHLDEAQRRGSARAEIRHRRCDGSTFPAEVSSRGFEQGGAAFWQCVVQDVSARKAAEHAARVTERKFRIAFHSAGLAVVLVERDGRITEHNRAAGELLGWGGELAGKRIPELTHETGAARSARQIEGLFDGKHDEYVEERRMVRRDGSIVDVLVRATAVRGDDGRVQYAMGIYEDVTEKKRLQAQLVVSDRMASLGTLAAGIAHEINNPLAYVLANVRHVRERIAGGVDPDLVQALSDAEEGADRVSAIVRDLKTFARVEEGLEVTSDLGGVLRSAVTLAQNEIKHRARLAIDAPALPPVSGAPHRLGQVFLNLLVNAAQAIPEGHASENEIRLSARAEGDHVAVEVADTGSGIDPQVRNRIFDPFFTTKPVGVGTGLGLSICHAIVSAAGGSIEVRSERGRGSTFRVLLPARGSAAGAAGTPARGAPSEGRRHRVLVVDDEPGVGRAIGRILVQHELVAVTTAREALALLEAAPAFDVVLCDLMMPQVTGMELYANLRERQPAIAARMVFMTGGAFTPRARAFLDETPNPTLEKPLDPRELAQVVARVASSAR